jgi:MFS family permease
MLTRVRSWSDRFHLGLLIVASFLMDLVFRAGAQAYQEAGLSLRARAIELSALGAVSAFCYSGVCLLAGTVSDRVGRKASALLACVGLALAYGAAGLVRDIHPLMSLTVLSGSALAFFWPAVQAWIADLCGRGREALARSLGVFNVCWSAGLAIGPTLTGLLWAAGSRGGSSQPLAFWSVVALVGLVAVVLAVTRTRPTDGGAGEAVAEDAERPHPYAGSLLFGARAGTFASWFAVGVVGSLFPKLGQELGFDERLRGMLASCYHVGQFALFVAALFATRWHFRRWPIVAAEVLALLGMVSILWAHHPAHFAVAFLLGGMCSSVAYTASLFHSLHGRSEDRGKLAGIHEAVLASGVFLSPLIGGVLAEYVSLRAPFPMVAAALAGAIVLQMLVWRSDRRQRRVDAAAG